MTGTDDLPRDPDPATPLDWLALALAVFGVVLFFCSAPFAAEEPRGWELVRYPKDGKSYDRFTRTHDVIASYDTRTACTIAAERVQVAMSGVRLRCERAR